MEPVETHVRRLCALGLDVVGDDGVHHRAIIVEGPVELRVGGDLGIDTTLAEEVEGDSGLR